MARFWKVLATPAHSQHGRGVSKRTVRYINIYQIDEVENIQPRTGSDNTKIPQARVHIHYGPVEYSPGNHFYRFADTYFDIDGVAEHIVTELEKMFAEDRLLTTAKHDHEVEEPAPADPTRLGYVFAKRNTSVVEATVDDIDDFDLIEFAGRAAATVDAALGLTEGFKIRVATTDIPINSSPVSAPYHVLTIGDAGNIKVSRSTAGTSLYLLADDAVMAFGIAISGHNG